MHESTNYFMLRNASLILFVIANWFACLGQSKPVSYVHDYVAYVYDYNTGMPIEGAIITVTSDDGQSVSAKSDSEGGVEHKNWKIGAERTYSVDIYKDGYFGAGDQFSTVGLSKSTKFIKEYLIQEVVINEYLPMPLVQFVSDGAELVVNPETNSKDSLDILGGFLEQNPTFVISLEAYTDIRGGDQYNKELSQSRAETCANYLMERGIDHRRIHPLGLGNKMLLISEEEIARLETDAERAAAHQFNERIAFRIVKTDWVVADPYSNDQRIDDDPGFVVTSNKPINQTRSSQNGRDTQPIRVRVAQDGISIEAVAVLALDRLNCAEDSVKSINEASVVEQELLGLYDIVDRNHLEMIMNEQRLAMSGLMLEEGALAQAGCLAGAQGTVIVTKGCVAGDDVLTIKMIDCTSSKMHWVANGPVDRIYDIMDEVRSQLR